MGSRRQCSDNHSENKSKFWGVGFNQFWSCCNKGQRAETQTAELQSKPQNEATIKVIRDTEMELDVLGPKPLVF